MINRNAKILADRIQMPCECIAICLTGLDLNYFRMGGISIIQQINLDFAIISVEE